MMRRTKTKLFLVGGVITHVLFSWATVSAAEQDLASTKEAYTVDPRHPEEFTALVPPIRAPRDLDLVAVFSPEAIQVDGHADEAIWAEAVPVQTLDRSSQRLVELRAAYTETHLYILATVPDVSENRTHRSYTFDPDEDVYRPTYDREDSFVIKWSMDGSESDLSLYGSAPRPHRADTWFWKACRTDPQGYADDKVQDLVAVPTEEGTPIPSANAGVLYLVRKGDAGTPSYRESISLEYVGEAVPRYAPQPPEGSRADVRAKGLWADGAWSLEFGRALDTTHEDDIVFRRDSTYLFGVSCYEIAGGKVKPVYHQPLYKTGDVFDRITLRFAETE